MFDLTFAHLYPLTLLVMIKLRQLFVGAVTHEVQPYYGMRHENRYQAEGGSD